MTAAEPFLIPLAGLYAALQTLDRLAKTAARRRLPRPVVSVGNLTLGGTGKTPFTVLLSGLLRDLRPVVLSRGYGGRRTGLLLPDGPPLHGRFGDEPELIRNLAACPVSVDPDRYRAGIRSLETAGVFILDDGFQHYRLHRDCDIVLLDTSVPPSEYRLLPLGRLREPLAALRRCHAAVLTRTERSRDDTVALLRRHLGHLPPQAVFRTASAHALIDPFGRTVAADALRGRPLTAFAGLAKPEAFFRAVRDLLAPSDLETIPFPDHHPYPAPDLRRLEAALGRGRLLVTTDKDAVKLAGRLQGFLVLRLHLVLDDPDRLRDLVLRRLPAGQRD